MNWNIYLQCCNFVFCLYTYIYICIFWQNFFINTNFVEHNRHFLCTYFLVDLFVLPYCFYRIRRELIDVLSIIVYIPRTFCPILGRPQERIYNKSDVTSVFSLLLCNSVFTYIYIYIYTYIYGENWKTK